MLREEIKNHKEENKKLKDRLDRHGDQINTLFETLTHIGYKHGPQSF